MVRSHRIQLDPTAKQARYFLRACGAARFVWNWALAEWNRLYGFGEKPKAVEIKKAFNSIKYEQFPWLAEVHRDAHSQPFANLQKAFSRFFKKTANRPVPKKRGKSRDSFYVANDKLSIKEFNVKLPVIGTVRMTEQLRFSGKIMSATVSRECDRWFISISVDVPDKIFNVPDSAVGIDLGLTTFATLSTGEKIEAPKPLRKASKKLKRSSRSHSRKKKGSKNRKKSALKLAKVHRRIKNIRKDFLHKLTTRLAKTHSHIGIEDLNVRGMVKNRKLSKAIMDASWSEFRRLLDYKAKTVVVFDRFYPSSKTCSHCGSVSEKMPLSIRNWTCPDCGTQHDRDINAARNLQPILAACQELTPIEST